MAKDERLFAPFPIEMDEHPKIIGLTDAAFRAIFEATFYSRRMLSDGFLDERIVLRRWGQDVADELSSNDPERPSWNRVDKGWQIHDFEKHHPLRAEIQAKRDAVSQRRSEAGKKGAERRWDSKPIANEWQTDGKGDGKPMASHSSETETEPQTAKKDIVHAARSRELANDFDEWWQVYPRKQGKEAARRKYLTVRKKIAADVLLKGVREYALLMAGEEKKFVKLPAGWLNDGRWEDDNHTRTAPSKPLEQFCQIHDGYPEPCASCARVAERGGNDF